MRQFKNMGSTTTNSSGNNLPLPMHHSIKFQLTPTPSFEILNKNPPSPSIFLTGYEHRRTSPLISTMKSEDDQIDLVEEPKLELGSDDDTDPSLKKETRRNKRKSLLPQRAVLGQRNDNLAGTSESSQDAEDAEKIFSAQSAGFPANLADETGPLLSHLFIVDGNDVIIDLSSADDILSQFNEDLVKESGKKLDEETIVNFKKEWKAHWGVKCNMCERVFPSRTDFDNHYRENYNLTPVYTCTVCNKTCEKYSTFRSHCYRHITEGRYKCEICSKGFSLQSVLKVHVMAKHTKAKPFMCEECGRGFVTRPGLRVHLKKHKTSQKEYYPCVECGKVLHTRGGLTSHMNVHRLGRRFMCDVCGKTFTQKVNMQQHVKQHTGDKPYSCDQCDKTFAERSHLARHHSCHSDQRPFKCDVCAKWYKTERCLKVHSLVHADKRPFTCSHCNKGFLSRTKLMQHSNIHTGERPYQCKYCTRSFTNFPNWLKHTRRRHKVDHRTGQALVPVKEEDSAFKEEDSVDAESPPGFVEIRPAPAPPTVEQLLAELGKVEGTNGWEQELVVMDEVNGVNGALDVTGFGNLLPLPISLSSQLPITSTIIDHNLLASLPIQLTDLNGQFIQTPLL